MDQRTRTFLLCAFIALGRSPLFAQAGALDTSFGVDGIAVTDIASLSDVGRAIVVQPDGKIIVGGSTIVGAHSHMVVLRYEPSGALDTSFSTDGIVVSAIDTTSDYAGGVALQPDGRILVAGASVSDSSYRVAVLRFTSNGSLDTSFAADGIALTDIGPGDDAANAIMLQPDGGIVVAGSSFNGSSSDFALVRYHQDGSLDSSFGNDGVVTTDLSSGNDWASAVLLQPNGKILVAGNSGSLNMNFTVARYLIDGSLDTGFGAGGSRIISITPEPDRCSAMTLQPDGKILLAGVTGLAGGPNTHADFGVVRLNGNGSFDGTFSSDGILTTDLGTNYDAADAIVLQPDGRIIAVGSSFFQFALVRYDPLDGSLDTTFGSEGIVTTSIGGAYGDLAFAAAIQGNGRIIVVGQSNDGGGNDIAVVRYLNDLDIGILEFTSDFNPIMISPNPIHDQAMLRYSLARDERLTIAIHDASGRLVRSLQTNVQRAQGTHQEPITLSGLPCGSYTLLISNGLASESVKVMKE